MYYQTSVVGDSKKLRRRKLQLGQPPDGATVNICSLNRFKSIPVTSCSVIVVAVGAPIALSYYASWLIEGVRCFTSLNAVLFSEVQCSAVQCSAVQCSAVQYNTVQCSAVQYSAVQYSAVQYSTMQCSSVQSSAAMQCKDVMTNRCGGERWTVKAWRSLGRASTLLDKQATFLLLFWWWQKLCNILCGEKVFCFTST